MTEVEYIAQLDAEIAELFDSPAPHVERLPAEPDPARLDVAGRKRQARREYYDRNREAECERMRNYMQGRRALYGRYGSPVKG